MKENRPETFLENAGRAIRTGGLIAGLIGIVTNPAIFWQESELPGAERF